VNPDFVPGGGGWQDYSVRNEINLRSGIYLKSQLQYEHISRYPMLFSGPRANVAAVFEVGLVPQRDK
jgi:hypothetical protein